MNSPSYPMGGRARALRFPVDPIRLGAIARKEVLQLKRDTRSLLLAFILPLLLLVIFGYAIAWDVRDIPFAVVDQDHTRISRDLISSLQSSGYFTLVERLEDPARIADELYKRRALIAFVIPPGFASDIETGRPARLQAIVDGSDANTATIAIGYTQAIAQSVGSRLAVTSIRANPPVRAESRIWYNEELKSRNMIVPGLVAVIMMIIAAILTSLTIAREWERGTMEQLAATPVRRLEVVLGKLLPYLAIGLIDVILCSVLGVVLFGVPFRGNPALLMILSFFFLVGALGLGIFISAFSKGQLMATQISMLATFLPAYLLSGFMFPISVMPAPLRAFTYIVPARYFLIVTRGIFLKGIGAEILFVQGLSMIAFSIVGLGLAVRVFHKEIR
jgi:ABC-2 type transport system permease protein